MNYIDSSTKNKIRNYFNPPYDIKEVVEFVDNIDSSFSYDFNNIKSVVYLNRTKNNFNLEFFKLVIQRASTIVKDKVISIVLIPSPAKKQFEFSKPLEPRNTNSGFTYIHRNEIIIFRLEEFPKVIIHELIHHDKNIHSDFISPHNKQLIFKHFNFHPATNFILNEAIVELWATIIHLSLVSKFYNIDFNLLLETEIQYSLFKSNQLLNLQKKQKQKKWFDKCNIYCYIIFKTIFLYYHNEFIKIYSFPYDDTKITQFLISHSKLPIVKSNPFFILNGQKIQRPVSSLCFMLLSDL